MEHAFSILMFIFGGALLLYSLILYVTGDVRLIRRYWAAKIDDEKEYARQFAKIMVLIAIAPIIGGIAGFFFKPLITGIITLAAFIAFLWVTVQIWKQGE